MAGAPLAFSDIKMLSIRTVKSNVLPESCAASTVANKDFCVMPVVKEISPIIMPRFICAFF
jgi:hypothetical protein